MYTIIGNGRLAQHMVFYFTALGLSFNHWYRKSDNVLSDCLQKSTHVLLLITDNQIDSFIETQWNLLQNHCLIHCSGALVSDKAYTAHMPMSFSHHLYTVEEYKNIPIIIEKNRLAFEALLPGLPNAHFCISREDKAYYHALCVMANNFTTLLWQKLFSEFENRFDIPDSMMMPYLKKTCDNLLQDYKHALTGPLARNDQQTIEKNLSALKEDPFLDVYQAFVNSYMRNHYENSSLFRKETA